MNIKEQTAALNAIPIQTVGAWLGLRVPLKGSIRCPFPNHKDLSPSFTVYGNGLRWTCHACNKSGGSIDLVMNLKGIQFLEAKQWLISQGNLGIQN